MGIVGDLLCIYAGILLWAAPQRRTLASSIFGQKAMVCQGGAALASCWALL
jgi:hypothetical protein